MKILVVQDLINELKKFDPKLPVLVNARDNLFPVGLELDGYVIRQPAGDSIDRDCLIIHAARHD